MQRTPAGAGRPAHVLHRRHARAQRRSVDIAAMFAAGRGCTRAKPCSISQVILEATGGALSDDATALCFDWQAGRRASGRRLGRQRRARAPVDHNVPGPRRRANVGAPDVRRAPDEDVPGLRGDRPRRGAQVPVLRLPVRAGVGRQPALDAAAHQPGTEERPRSARRVGHPAGRRRRPRALAVHRVDRGPVGIRRRHRHGLLLRPRREMVEGEGVRAARPRRPPSRPRAAAPDATGALHRVAGHAHDRRGGRLDAHGAVRAPQPARVDPVAGRLTATRLVGVQVPTAAAAATGSVAAAAVVAASQRAATVTVALQLPVAPARSLTE